MSNKTQNVKKAKTGSALSYSAAAFFIFIILFGLLSLMFIKAGQRSALSRACLGNSCAYLEKAATGAQREKGLSGRSGLVDRTGMLFIFDSPGYQCMWMKDMKFNLDMLWLDNKGKIIKIVRNVSPATYPASFCGNNAKYVIELNSGEATSLGWNVGDLLQL